MQINKNPRIAIAGSVNSSHKTLQKLIEYNMNITGVLGLSPEKATNVSGYNDLETISKKNNLNFTHFENINNDETIKFIKDANPDLLFVVGLSQIVKKPLLNLPTAGCIGYHPTLLPEGRGRAAIAWIILGEAKPAASFFLMDEGVDSGDIIGQIPVRLSGDEYPQKVIDKIMDAVDIVLDDILPKLKIGVIDLVKQEDEKATFLGKRNPVDGFINWEKSAEEIALLVRAVSKPLPGAFTYANERKLIIWKSKALATVRYIGVPGRIAEKTENEFSVYTGKGLLNVQDFEGVNLSDIRVGQKLGVDVNELFLKLKNLE